MPTRRWRTRAATTALHPLDGQGRTQPRTFEFRTLRFDGQEHLEDQPLWIESRLSSEVRDNLARRHSKGWEVRLGSDERTCGLVVRYAGDNVYWPHDPKAALPITFDDDEPAMYWWYTLLVLSRNHVWMGTGEYGWGLRMLADLLARPDADRPWIDPADAEAIAAAAEGY